MKLRKGDEIIVITGSDKGKRGKILRTIPSKNKIIVAGVNLKTKHSKPSQSNPSGSIEKIEAAINVSNVAYYDDKAGGPSRVAVKRNESGKRVRYLKKSGTELDN